MDIESLGDVVADKLVESGLTKDPLDLFEPEFTASKLSALNLGSKDEPRIFGEKNANKVIEAIERARHHDLAQWLHALGIPNIGKTIAHTLAGAHRDFSDLADSHFLRNVVALDEKRTRAKAISPSSKTNPPKTDVEKESRRLEYEQLKQEIESLRQQIKAAGLSSDIGPVVAKSLIQYFESKQGRKTLSRLQHLGINPQGGKGSKHPTAAGPLAGKRVVITGTLSTDRISMQKMIRDAGGEAADSLTSSTAYLVVGEEPGATKLRDAKKFGIPEIDEKQLLKMLGKSAKTKTCAGGDLFSWSENSKHGK